MLVCRVDYVQKWFIQAVDPFLLQFRPVYILVSTDWGRSSSGYIGTADIFCIALSNLSQFAVTYSGIHLETGLWTE